MDLNIILKCFPNSGANKNSWFLILIHKLSHVPNMKPIHYTQMSRKNISFYTSWDPFTSNKSQTVSARRHHLRKVFNYCNIHSLLYHYTAKLPMNDVTVKFKIGLLTVHSPPPPLKKKEAGEGIKMPKLCESNGRTVHGHLSGEILFEH